MKSHGSATVRLKLDIPQPVRCYPSQSACVNGCLELRAKPRHQAKEETKGNTQRCGSRVGTSGQCVLVSHKNYPRSMMPEKLCMNRGSSTYIGVGALQETRLPPIGSIRGQDYMLYWQGREPYENRTYGVGFAIRNSLPNHHQNTSRIISLRLSTSTGPANVLSIYALTLCYSKEENDELYEELEVIIKEISAAEQLYLLGDFNARVGANHDSWSRNIGNFGFGRLNENGPR